MSKLIFNSDEVRKLVAHSKGKEHPSDLYGEPLKDKEYLYLVHDDGVYLMSGAKEILPNVGGDTVSVVAYADGCHPKKDEDFREQSRYLVGGDDFGEPIGLDLFEAALKLYDALGLKQIVLNFSETSIGVEVPKKKGRGR
jgi:uncharacterized protein YozE (UPF0346 family)